MELTKMNSNNAVWPSFHSLKIFSFFFFEKKKHCRWAFALRMVFIEIASVGRAPFQLIWAISMLCKLSVQVKKKLLSRTCWSKNYRMVIVSKNCLRFQMNTCNNAGRISWKKKPNYYSILCTCLFAKSLTYVPYNEKHLLSGHSLNFTLLWLNRQNIIIAN